MTSLYIERLNLKSVAHQQYFTPLNEIVNDKLKAFLKGYVQTKLDQVINPKEELTLKTMIVEIYLDTKYKFLKHHPEINLIFIFDDIDLLSSLIEYLHFYGRIPFHITDSLKTINKLRSIEDQLHLEKYRKYYLDMYIKNISERIIYELIMELC